jgi:hypothetical protein
VIVNEEFAKMYWPSQDPLGKRLHLSASGSPWLEVVGVTRTGKYLFLGERPTPFIYLPFAQHERSRMSLLVESAGVDPSPLVAPLRGLVRDLDPNQPIYNVRPLSTFYQQRALAVPWRVVQVVGTLGAIGLILSLIGLYGLVAFSVACRTREIGIRMAIGAGRADVLGMVLRQGLALSLSGVVVGMLASLAVGRLLAAGMGELGGPSVSTYLIVPPLLIGLTMAASYVPARRASLVDPLLAVRSE